MRTWADPGYPLRNKGRALRSTDLRLYALRHYAERCQCPGGCDADFPEFMTWDHPDGNGADHKRAAGIKVRDHDNFRMRSLKFAALLDRAGWPDPPVLVAEDGRAYYLRVLCWNCNASLAYIGYCPHAPLVRQGYVLAPVKPLAGLSLFDPRKI